MTGRIPLDHLNSDQYDQLCDELDALRQVARGYCPDCGRGDAAPTVTDWEQQKQRADQAEAAFTRLREARDRIAHAPGHVDAIWCLDQLDAALAEPAPADDTTPVHVGIRHQIAALRDELNTMRAMGWLTNRLDKILNPPPPINCARCKDRGYVPDWMNWDAHHGEPRPKPCPDCQAEEG